MTNTTLFQRALAVVLANEGGYSNIAADRGGETNYGITVAEARKFGYSGPMKTIPMSVVESIYKTKYWKDVFETFPEAVAIKVFDTGVNVGPSQAIKFLQRALTTLGVPTADDGVAGPKTAVAVSQVPAGALLAQLRGQQKAFYLNLIARNASQEIFRNGWLRRAAS